MGATLSKAPSDAMVASIPSGRVLSNNVDAGGGWMNTKTKGSNVNRALFCCLKLSRGLQPCVQTSHRRAPSLNSMPLPEKRGKV